MGNDDKLIPVGQFNTELNKLMGTDYEPFMIYRSKGLLAHLINRNHYLAVKHIDDLGDIIAEPDYVGRQGDNIEFVKEYRENIFISVKLDAKKNKHYIATMFDIKKSKVETYVNNGRLIPVTDNQKWNKAVDEKNGK